MKINLAENMLRFGVKNLNETAIRNVKTLAEQTPATPTTATTTTPPTTPKGVKYTIPVTNTLFYYNGTYSANISVDIEYFASSNEIKVIQLNAQGAATDNKIIKTLTPKAFSIKGPFTGEEVISEQIGNALKNQLTTINKQFTDILQTFTSHVAYTKTSGAYDKTTGASTKAYDAQDVSNAWFSFVYEVGNAVSGYVFENPKMFPNLISKPTGKPVQKPAK
jgi:hypothetical protein